MVKWIPYERLISSSLYRYVYTARGTTEHLWHHVSSRQCLGLTAPQQELLVTNTTKARELLDQCAQMMDVVMADERARWAAEREKEDQAREKQDPDISF